MAEAVVREWIADFKAIRSAELRSFANNISQNNELIQGIFTILEEKRYHEEFLEPVCNQFFSFFRSREELLQNFARQYIPCLIGLYLSNVSKGIRKNVRCVEVMLLGIYNLEVIDSSGKAACLSFRLPLLSKPSIYHEPMSLSHTALSEHALSNLQYAESRMITVGPFTEVEKIIASNRMSVMTVLLWLYNQNVGNLSTFSHMSLCKMCSRIIKQGFNRANRPNFGSDCSSGYNNPHPRPIARIPLSSPFLLELIYAVYHAAFNGLASIGLQCLDELHSRAMQEMMPDVLLVTNAIRNSLKANPSGQPSDDPMGISVALSPTAVVSTVCRAITNASFRAKKLPDDIPIQKEKDDECNESNQLSAITEESEEIENQPDKPKSKKHSSSGAAFSNITKVGVLQLKKNKDKKKDKESASSNESVDNGKINGKHLEICSDETDIRFSNNDQVSFRNSFPSRTDIHSPKNPNESRIPGDSSYDSLSNAKYVNHSTAEVVITNDGTSVLKSILHKSESANGLQNSSLQTAV